MKTDAFMEKKKRWWLIKQHSEFQACQDFAGLNGTDDPKTLWCSKINKRTLATCSAFPLVLDHLTCCAFYLRWTFPHVWARSWDDWATLDWEPSHWMYETRTKDGQNRAGSEERRERWQHWHQDAPSLGTQNGAELRIKHCMSSGREWLMLPGLISIRRDALWCFVTYETLAACVPPPKAVMLFSTAKHISHRNLSPPPVCILHSAAQDPAVFL